MRQLPLRERQLAPGPGNLRLMAPRNPGQVFPWPASAASSARPRCRPARRTRRNTCPTKPPGCPCAPGHPPGPSVRAAISACRTTASRDLGKQRVQADGFQGGEVERLRTGPAPPAAPGLNRPASPAGAIPNARPHYQLLPPLHPAHRIHLSRAPPARKPFLNPEPFFSRGRPKPPAAMNLRAPSPFVPTLQEVGIRSQLSRPLRSKAAWRCASRRTP